MKKHLQTVKIGSASTERTHSVFGLRNFFLTKLFVLLGVLLAGTSAWADTTVTMSTFSAISGNVDGDANVSYEAAKGAAATAPAVNSGQIRVYQNGGTFTVTANNGCKITSVTLGSAMVTTVTYSVDGGSASSGQSISAGGTTTVSNLDCSSVLFTCTGTDKSHRLYVNYLSVTYSTGGGTLTPSISADDVSLDYDETAGEISYTINNPVSGGTVAAAKAAADTWISNVTVDSSNSKVTFDATENDGSTDRTGTITLTYTYNTNQTVTKDVTVTQGHLFTPTDGEFDFTTGEGYGSGLTPSNSSSYIEEAKTWTAGNITLVTDVKYRYWNSNGNYDLRVYSGGTLTLSAPSGYAISEIAFNGNNLDNLSPSDGTLSSGTWTGSANSITFTHAQASGTVTINTISVTYSATAAGKTLYIKSDYAPYVWAWYGSDNYTGGNWPGAQTTDTEVKYGVTWHKYTVAADLFNLILTDNYGQTQTIADISSDTYFVYNSQGDGVGNTQYLIITDPTVVPVSANNVATTIGSSVAADVTNTHGMTLSYASSDSSIATVANDGTVTGVGAGTATITVSWNTGWDSANNGTGFLAGSVTFDAVITAPVADYATLPFSFTGGKADIENTNGLTQNSLGTDYSGTLANLKFDSTGDALVLKFNSEPGVLTFNMRGNSFSGGTFKLQESADGLNFTDVKTYDDTNIVSASSGDGQVETISILQSTSRYIQWVYTNKSSGNVGVGNIHLAVPDVSQYTVTPASNNTSYGTVAIANNVITATPAEHYRVSTTTPYEVSPSGAATVTDNGNGTFTVSDLTDDCTVTINFEAIPTYEVTITAPTNGTLVVKNAGTAIASGDMIEEGTELTIEATPAAGYNFQNWQANDGSTHTFTNNFKWTVNAAVTISANFVAKEYHNANFYVNGVKTSVEYETGESITFPADPADISGKTFRGWYDDHYTSADTAPVYVVTATQTMGSSDLNFYAVFATVTGGGGSDVDDVLDNANTIGATQTSYTTWTTSGLNADYAGQSAGQSGTIQLRSNNSNSGIVSTTSAGKIKKVTVTWSTVSGISISDGRTVDIYGKNSAYSDPTDLYNSSNQGTLLGSVVYHTSGNGTSTTEVTVSGDYEYVGIRSRSGAAYFDDITITWTSGTSGSESGYCTEIPVTFTMNSVGTSTYVLDRDVDAYLTYEESGLEIYKVDAFTVQEVSMVRLGQDDSGTSGSERYIPQGTPVIIMGDASTAYDVYVASAAAQVVSDNILNAGTDAYPSGVGPFYVLQKPAGTTEAKFYKLSANRVVPTTRAYLDATDMVQSLPAPSPAGRKIMGIDGGDLTGIDGINNDANENVFADGKWYNLQGIEVKNPSKGIYLHNGKKVVVK